MGKKHHWIVCFTLLLFIGILMPTSLSAATRAFSPRFSANSNGDIYLIGNTAMTCNSGAGALNNAACANARAGIGTGTQLNNNDYSMIFVDIDGDGTTFQSSSANLAMPSGSTVLWAGLYWGGEYTGAARDQVRFKTPASGGYVTVNAMQDDSIPNVGCPGNTCDRYSAFADVTSLVNAGGSGTYTAANIQSTPNGVATASTYGGWSLVVAFSNNSLPMRNLMINDGFTSIACGYPDTVNIPVAGFLTPYNGPVNTSLGAIAGEGDLGSAGDNFQLNGTNLVDPVRVSGNFFNTAISNMGARVSSINPNYYNQLGWDVARINASGILANGATSATITLTTGGECYYPSTVTFATDLYVPIIIPNVTKIGVDVNGGNLVPGDILRYTVAMNNTGYDTGTNLSVIDNIPPYTAYIPGSLRIISGPAGAPTGTMTDGSGDDAAEYIATGTPRVVFRLGSGANATTGGNLALGRSTSLSFDVQLSSSIPSGTVLTNTAQISYSGQTLGVVYAAASSAASSAVFVPPAVTKAFTPPVVADTTGTSTLSIVFSNPASNLGAVTGVAVTDTYPAGLVNATPANPSLTCTAGSTVGSIVGGVAGGNTIGMTGTTIAQNGSCTLSATVKGTGNGIFTNNLGQVTTTNDGNTVSPSATAVFSVGRPAITKVFSSPSMLIGNNATITFTLSNPTATPFSGATFKDTYPAGLVNAAPLALGGTCTVRTVDAATLAGGGVFNLTSVNIPAGGSCTVTVLVTSSTAGSYDNTTSGVITTQTPTAGAPSNTANLLVYAPVTATKVFTPASVSTGGASQLAITITNPNPAGTLAVTGATLFTDTYPTNLVNSTTPTPVITCTAGSSATLVGGAAGGNTIGMSGGTLASGGTCTITVFVTSATANTYPDNADTITTTNAGSSTIPAASLNVSSFTPPGATKSFTGPVAGNQPSVMTIALTNSNGSAITGVSFSDSYPAGLVNTATPNGTTTCTGGMVIAVAGGSSLSLSGATIPTSGCTVTVNVTSASPGAYYNNTGLIFTGNAGVGAGANGSLQVLAPPTITKSFGINPVAAAGATTLILTLTNPAGNTVPLSGVGVTDTYPAGMTNTGTPGGVTTCLGGVVAAANNGPSVSLSGAAIPVGGNCTVTANLKAPATAGEYTNTTDPVTSSNAGNGNTGAAAIAILSVGQPGIAKSFGTSPILAGAASFMTITLTNPTGVAMTAAAFTDTYPAGMTNTGAPGGVTTCAGGTVIAANNGPSVSLSGGTIPANGSCTVKVNATSTVTATNTIPAGALTISGGTSNANPASAILQVTPPPQATKSFFPASIQTSSGAATSTLTITITNPTSNTLTGVAFTDNYPSANLDNGADSTINCTAGSSGTRTGNSGNSLVGMTGGTLLGNGSCTVTVPVFSNTAGTYNNTTGNITSTNGGTGQPATNTLTVLTPFTAAKTFSPATVNAFPDSSILTVTLTNPNATTAVTGVSFTDSYPANLINTTPPVFSTTCGGTMTATAGGGSLALSGGIIPAGGNCKVTAVVTSTTVANKTNPMFTVTSDNDSSATVAAATITVLALIAPTVTKTFVTPSILLNGTSLLSIAITNTSGSTITGITFADTYPAGSGIVNTTNATAVGACNTGSAVGISGGNTVGMNNMTINAGLTCTVSITVKGPIPGTWVNSTGLVTSGNAAAGGPASATLTVVLPPPTIAKSYAAINVALNGSVNTSFLISNPNTFGLSGISFADNLPAGLSATNGTTPTCGGSLVITGGNTLTFTGGTLAASPATCTITVPVSGTAPGTQNNTTGVISSNESGSGLTSNPATVNVYAPPTVTKGFAPVSILVGGTTTMTITVTNPAGNPGNLTGVSIDDTYTGTLKNNAAGSVVCSSSGGSSATLTGGVNNGTTVGFKTGTIVPGGTCTITQSVTATTTANNTTGLSAATGPLTLTGTAAGPVTLPVFQALQVTKTPNVSTATPGSIINYVIGYKNPNATTWFQNVVITDPVPAYTTYQSAICGPYPPGITSCTISAPAVGGTGIVTWTLGGTLDAGSSGTVTLSVQVK
jgi:uncharacterized repeat protein (TIGR01451 family)